MMLNEDIAMVVDISSYLSYFTKLNTEPGTYGRIDQYTVSDNEDLTADCIDRRLYTIKMPREV